MNLQNLFQDALKRRANLLETLAAEDTDCVRLFHGAVEGVPGLSIDRYGRVVLVQTGRQPLSSDELAQILEFAEAGGFGAHASKTWLPVWNHRPAFRKEGFAHHHLPPAMLEDERAREMGLSVRVNPRHGGLDPLLFLDLRAGRRAVSRLSKGKSVLNLFAYTCGLGLCAAAGGAREVWNVDVSGSALEVGRLNAVDNGLLENDGQKESYRLIQEDAMPVLRQLAGLPLKGRAYRRRKYLKLPARTFDLTLLDPPRWAKSPFGAIDVIRDYPTLLKPAILATSAGGHILATNHVSTVDKETFVAMFERTAEKIGRGIEKLESIMPDDDFPSPDGKAPLKMILATLE